MAPPKRPPAAGAGAAAAGAPKLNPVAAGAGAAAAVAPNRPPPVAGAGALPNAPPPNAPPPKADGAGAAAPKVEVAGAAPHVEAAGAAPKTLVAAGAAPKALLVVAAGAAPNNDAAGAGAATAGAGGRTACCWGAWSRICLRSRRCAARSWRSAASNGSSLNCCLYCCRRASVCSCATAAWPAIWDFARDEAKRKMVCSGGPSCRGRPWGVAFNLRRGTAPFFHRACRFPALNKAVLQ